MLRSVPNSEGKQPICRQAARKLPTILISHVYHGPAGIRTQYRIHEQSALGGVVFVQIRMEIQMVLSEVGERRYLSLIHISEPTRRTPISYAVFCLKKKNKPEILTST